VLYVVGKEDHCVTEKVARNLYLKQQGARFEVEVIEGDHVLMLSRPEEVVGVVRRFAGEKVGEEDDDDKGRMEL
jgi:surfactin synthase thioesterase subunit